MMISNILTKKNMLIITLVSIFFFSSCTKDEDTPDNPGTSTEEKTGTLNVTLTATAGGQDLDYSAVYNHVLPNQSFRITKLKMYFTNMALLKNGGDSVLVNDVSLLDFKNQKTHTFTAQIPIGVYNGFRFFNGVDSARNHLNPASYDDINHPLGSLVSQDMHWSWAPGYIALKIEGIADTSGGGGTQMDRSFLYHLGRDTMYKEITTFNSENVLIEENKTTSLDIKLNVAQLFFTATDTIDFSDSTSVGTHSMSESEMGLSFRVLDMFANSFSK